MILQRYQMVNSPQQLASLVHPKFFNELIYDPVIESAWLVRNTLHLRIFRKCKKKYFSRVVANHVAALCSFELTDEPDFWGNFVDTFHDAYLTPVSNAW